MNTPNPLVPQGTFQDKGKAQIRITVFAILAVHVVALGVLLIAGCNKKADPEPAVDNTGIPPVPPIPVDTNAWPTPPSANPPVPDNTGILPPPVPSNTTYADPAAPPPSAPSFPLEPVQPPQPEVTSSASEHTIVKGESFYTVGKKYGVGYKAIADANPGVNPNRLKIGQKIIIPAAKASAGGASTLAPSPAPGETTIKTYKVKSGDNLGRIARANGVSVKQLRSANNLRTDRITVGQTLKIPVKAPAAVAPPVEAAPPVPAPMDPGPLAPPPGGVPAFPPPQ